MKGYMSILFGSLLVLVLSLGSMNYVDAILCDNYERDDGKIICVSESTATKLMERGWKLTIMEKIDVESKTVESKTVESKTVESKTVESETVDLNGIVFESSVKEGDYILGVITKQREANPLERLPPPTPVNWGVVVFPNAEVKSFGTLPEGVSASSIQPSNKLDSYKKYFPTYIPDGLELKFFSISDRDSSYSLYLIYAPIVVEVTPETYDTQLHDLGGIEFKIYDYGSKPIDLGDDFEKHFISTGATVFTFDNSTVPIYLWNGTSIAFGEIYFPNNMGISVLTSGNSGFELQKMFESVPGLYN